jgi:hypothetical protein
VFTLLANSHVWNIAYSVFACAIDVVLTGVMLYILHQNRTELSRSARSPAATQDELMDAAQDERDHQPRGLLAALWTAPSI